eukprot:CAMPEP_0174295104 /NCGR_PEP_ID=MMETSP0809-20121228/43674_1 /TAXON_ID=73025 ORGANISM="Eutreptiella gymnastica-like, Strain CCMP1594" /NCGR_SAMPLE_ID=MMETSP0809 /ASSEMBLY_ACC=CAM_ASM_000658 /LENGTH=50 /DNA_ID=CAMNT_0015397089 /DNA_START=35 /DNA_END=187 /DNA_ORIENTATION=+
MIWNRLALCYISRISGEDHPPKVTVMGTTECKACWCQHGTDAGEGQQQHL